ncbi:MAG: Crp/Fnr family transcriptional regulator [Candidatus Sumerlaeia bacterium]|nr:Crp/Fnr family transcriptional regulator [Candidatus Sumerlaeia bacterium]
MSGVHMEPRIWSLRTSALFEDATESVLNWAEDSARERRFQRGEVITVPESAGRSICVVLEGQIKLRTFSESGKEQIIDVASVGDTFGPLEKILDNGYRVASKASDMATEAVALSKGALVSYNIDEFHRLVEQRPFVILNVSRILGLKQRRFEIRLTRLLYRSATGKLAGLLSELGERFGEEDGSHIRLPFRLTHQEMASIIGAKRETVSEAMALLELEEVIRAEKGGILVLQPERLDSIL